MDASKLTLQIYLDSNPKKPTIEVALLKEEDIDEFFNEMNNDEKIMELGDDFFAKERFIRAKVIRTFDKK